MDLLQSPKSETTPSMVVRLAAARNELQNIVACELQESLARYVAEQPQNSTIEQKRLLVRQINGWLRDLQLAVKSEDGKLGRLYVKHGRPTYQGGFAIDLFSRERTLSSPHLEDLIQLAPYQRREHFVEQWAKRVGTKSKASPSSPEVDCQSP